MNAPKHKKVKPTSFSDFMRNASTQEKNEFFAKVVEAATEEQRLIIAKAKSMNTGS